MEQMRIAGPDDAKRICDFYRLVCERQSSDQYGADWHYGIYPSEDALTLHLQKGEICCALTGEDTDAFAGMIVSAAVLEKHADPRYAGRFAGSDIPADKILTLHLLAVHPDFRGRKLADRMLDFMIDYGREQGFRAIQLDVLKGNLPAERLYQKHGFVFARECRVVYEDTGGQTVHLYELDL